MLTPLYCSYDETPTLSADLKRQGVIYALGMFDGLHIGHQAVLHRAKAIAAKNHCLSGVFTFSTHPKARLHTHGMAELLASSQEKETLLAEQGFDVLIMPPFTQTIRELPREAFVQVLMKERLGATHLVIGHDFHFGYKRLGNAAWLKQHADSLGINVDVVDPICPEGSSEYTPVSSTWIRQSLKEGDVEQANALLGRPYSISGVSVSGLQNGRKLGFPTINVRIPHTERLMPKQGVYVARLFAENRWWPAVLNYGVAPTIYEGGAVAPQVEIHVLETFPYSDWINNPATIQFLKRIRDERRFDGLDALKVQLAQDTRVAHEWHGIH